MDKINTLIFLGLLGIIHLAIIIYTGENLPLDPIYVICWGYLCMMSVIGYIQVFDNSFTKNNKKQPKSEMLYYKSLKDELEEVSDKEDNTK